MQESWLQTARRSDVAKRALKVALVVGTILTAINQGDLLLAGEWTLTVLTKIALTYLVPYCVSTFAAVQAIRFPSRES